MKTKGATLTKEERDVLVLAATHPRGRHLNNTEIARRLGTSVTRVKTLIHQACIKLEAHNRIEAIFIAMLRGEISLKDVYSLDELAEIISTLTSDMLRRIAYLIRQELEHRHLPREDEQIILMSRRRDGILTNRERDVLILAGRGLTNIEIADKLYISIGAVRTFLNRACRKLGARRRSDAVVLALKQREIGVGEICSINEVIQGFSPLGAESLEKMAQLLNQKLGQEPVPTGS